MLFRPKVVTADQHRGYAESVKQYCPNADLVWDRFHLVQSFNEALNEERKKEWNKYGDPDKKGDDLLSGKYRYIYLTKAKNRNQADQQHIDQVMSKNERIAKLEMIKEHFHKMFDTQDGELAKIMLLECLQWSMQTGSVFLDRKSTRLNSSHTDISRMPSSA